MDNEDNVYVELLESIADLLEEQNEKLDMLLEIQSQILEQMLE